MPPLLLFFTVSVVSLLLKLVKSYILELTTMVQFLRSTDTSAYKE